MLSGRSSPLGPNCTYTSEFFVYKLCQEDAIWILMACFIIFTMQTGFGMLESGCVSVKNEANIMMKNFVDVVFGGLTYWMFGFSMSFGTGPGSSPVFGIGEYPVDEDDIELMGPVLAAFLFHLSFATTATTIVSGALAERCSFKAYCLFSMFNTIIYCVPARWLWDETGFLKQMGVIDMAGAGAVHILGGTSGFFGAWMLGPRQGRYAKGIDPLAIGNPMNCLVGLFVLWWGWLAFNSGSTYGVHLKKWEFAARAAVNTMIASFGGGIAGSGYAFFKSRPKPEPEARKYFEVMDIVNPILGSLVASTAGCGVYHTPEAFVTGFVGGALVIVVSSFGDRLGVDDPVGATAVHAFGGFWGLMAIGLFTEDDKGYLGITNGQSGIFRGGDTHLLQVQLFASVCVFLWSGLTTTLSLWVINKFLPIRMGTENEQLGSDFVEHSILRDPITGRVIAHRREARKRAEKDLMTVSVIAGSSTKACRLVAFRQSLSEFNRWRKIRMKALAASFFSIGLRKKRAAAAMSAPKTSTLPITFEDNSMVFKTTKQFPRPIFITEEFFAKNSLENTNHTKSITLNPNEETKAKAKNCERILRQRYHKF